MRAYYNEIDPFAARWLRNLIVEGHIAPGEVDERDIRDVRPSELRGYTQHHFFAGVGVWSYALRRAGWPDDRPVWTGSCPCQPFSAAGRRIGTLDERHLWPSWLHLIQQHRPPVVFGEQVASKDGLAWLDLVSTDLEAGDYSIGAATLPACGVGAPHLRQRLWFVADATGERRQGERVFPPRGRQDQEGLQATGSGAVGGGPVNGFWQDAEWIYCRDGKHRPIKPGTFPLVDGTPKRVGRLRGYGNAIVAPLAAEFVAAYLDLER